ncbi:hypothetical protein [Aureimonas sp. AU40]|uniref:hypothetical protein n=1 Tax=Aureimonas sp. AU40 TaxID=1637747 RepID=UPI000782FFFA|nr:hypothetical protein [Aureimonas sp. AU40]
MFSSHKHRPRFIALCGNPGAGKSEVQRILSAEFDYRPYDDGFPIRDFAMRHCGLDERQVYTQAGKLETVTIAGKEWVVRDLLGQIGNRIEDLFGMHGIPAMAVAKANTAPDRCYSFGSVRRDQGAYYKAHGGIVVEVVNPLADDSPYEFDHYDRTIVDYRIENNALAYGLRPQDALHNLRQKVAYLMHQVGEDMRRAEAA